MGVRSHRAYWAALAALSLVVAACGNVTKSEEYQALLAERDSVANELESTTEELIRATETLAGSQTEANAAEVQARAAEDRADRAESDLVGFRSLAEEVMTASLGLAGAPDDVECLLNELSLEAFFTVSLVGVDADPVSAMASIDPTLLGEITAAGLTCGGTDLFNTAGIGGETGSASIAGASLPLLPDSGPDPAIGLPAPEVRGADFDGVPVTIANDGHAKIIVFLAHWCSHCELEVPIVQDWIEATQLPANVEFYSIATSVDQTRDNYPPSAWLEREGWTSPVLVDNVFSSVGSAFGLTAYPFWVFISADGTVVARISGRILLDDLDSAVATLQVDAADSNTPESDTTGTMRVMTDITLTGNHAGDILIAADNVTLNCAGYTISGRGSAGIELRNRTGVTISGCVVDGFSYGVLLDNSDGNTLTGNTSINATEVGFCLCDKSQGNTLTGNVAAGADIGFLLMDTSGNLLTGNSASENQLGFALNQATFNDLRHNLSNDNDTGDAHSGVGFDLYDNASNNTFTGNTANGNESIGFWTGLDSSNNTYEENSACDNGDWDAAEAQPSNNDGNTYIDNEFCFFAGI